jgi:site-specific recombinase XerD
MHKRLLAAFLVMDRHRRGQGVVFAREDGEMLSLTAVNQVIFDEWLRPLLGQHITPHQLRHTFATLIVEKGGSMDEVRALMGHTSIATTQTYILTSAERLRKAVDLL